jgi:uncharacterized RDD family membrane protein YckC
VEPENPYQSPTVVDDEYRVPYLTAVVRTPGISPGNTIFPRYIAANVDVLLATLFMLLALKANPLDYRILHIVVAVLAFLAYYFIFESLFARTPGKFLMGLVVRKFDGSKCGWREAAIRTALRVVEVNPLLLGALPACAMILISKHRQRLGDKLADTVVVLARRVHS